MTKKMIRVRVKSGLYNEVSIDPYDLEGSFDKAIAILQHFEEIYEGRDIELCYEEEATLDDHKSFYLYEQRLETDEEYKKRLEKEERHLEYKREQFERLKKELGE